MKSKTKIKWINFLRPDCFPYPYTTEQAFEVFKWLVLKWEKYRDYGQTGAYELLSKNPSCLNFSSVHPITSINDLRSRFHYLFLYPHERPEITKWKVENGISIMGEKWIVFNHYTPFEGNVFGSEHDTKTALETLLSTRDKTLKVSLNKSHPKAKRINSIKISISALRGFKFIMDYGYKNDGSWGYVLAESGSTETFADTMLRAIATLSRLT